MLFCPNTELWYSAQEQNHDILPRYKPMVFAQYIAIVFFPVTAKVSLPRYSTGQRYFAQVQCHDFFQYRAMVF
jgi:hypothetical protein